MKSRFAFGLLAVMMVLALAQSSFAQVNIQIFNTPSPQEIATNHTAATSDPLSAGSGITVSGSLVANSSLSTTNLILTFPAPISVGAASTPDTAPIGDQIRIQAATGVFTNATILSRAGNTLTIALIGCVQYVVNPTAPSPTTAPCAAGGDVPATPGNSSSGSFRIVSTLIDANSLSGAGAFAATASLSSSSNNFILSTTSFPVINTLGAGIATLAQGVISGTNPGSLTVFTNKNVPNPTTKILITEGFNFAWRNAAENQHNSPGAAGVGADQIRLTFSGIPSTSTLTLGISATSSGTTVAFATNTVVPNPTGGANTAFLTILNDNTSSIDQVELTATLSTPTSNPTVGTITVTATMFPVDTNTGYRTTVTNASGTTTSTVVVPRFLAAEVGPATIGNIVPATTTMLIPLAEKTGPFDTGISIANTTADPFGANGGGATPTAGTITLNFFPRNATANGAGTPFSLTTSATVRPGAGLSTDGTLAAGGTWTVLLSELLPAASQTGDFVGYIFAQTNFLLAHGEATITDFKTFSLASLPLVLPPPAQASRNSPANSVESLNQ